MSLSILSDTNRCPNPNPPFLNLFSLPQFLSPISRRRQHQKKTMSESVLSARRAAQLTEEGDEDDESKVTKKHHHISSSFGSRVFNYVARIGYLGPCLSLLCLVLLSVFVLHSRNLFCVSVSPFDQRSRVGFFGLGGADTDFGSLGVPCCKSMLLIFTPIL